MLHNAENHVRAFVSRRTFQETKEGTVQAAIAVASSKAGVQDISGRFRCRVDSGLGCNGPSVRARFSRGALKAWIDSAGKPFDRWNKLHAERRASTFDRTLGELPCQEKTLLLMFRFRALSTTATKEMMVETNRPPTERTAVHRGWTLPPQGARFEVYSL